MVLPILGAILLVDFVCEMVFDQGPIGWASENLIAPVVGIDPVAEIDNFIGPYIDPYLQGAGEWLGEHLIAPVVNFFGGGPDQAYFDGMFGAIFEWMDGMTEWANAMTEWAVSVSMYLFVIIGLAVFIIILIIATHASTNKKLKRWFK
jgi:hypothetical protein